MDIGQGSSMVELLTQVVRVPGSIPDPAIYFHFIYILIPPFLLQYIVLKFSGYHVDFYVSLLKTFIHQFFFSSFVFVKHLFFTQRKS